MGWSAMSTPSAAPERPGFSGSWIDASTRWLGERQTQTKAVDASEIAPVPRDELKVVRQRGRSDQRVRRIDSRSAPDTTGLLRDGHIDTDRREWSERCKDDGFIDAF